MPYPNYHAARIKDPKAFDHIVVLKTLPNGILLKGGPLKSDPKGGTQAQTYWFPKAKFSAAEAKKWLKDNKIKYVSFEPALEGKSQDAEHEVRSIVKPEFRIAEQEGKPKSLIGYPAVFNKLSESICDFKEKIEPGAFKKSLSDGDDVRALFNHDPHQLLGRRSAKTLKLSEDRTGLLTEIVLPDTTLGRDIVVLVKRGDLAEMSFGFQTRKDEWITEDGQLIRTLKEVKLLDVSVCTFPAYPDTTVAVRSLEQWEHSQAQQGKGARELMRMRLRLALTGETI